MRYWLGRAALVLAAIFLALTFVNASWLADKPAGTIKLIAHRGVHQLFDHQGLTDADCTATRIELPVHNYLENTTRSMRTAAEMGADVVEMDIAPTRDGKIAVFHDWTVGCRTEGTGDTRSKTLTELQSLDPGYGYTADGGKSFPLRGLHKDQIPSLEAALAFLPRTAIRFNFKSRDPAEAEQLVAALKRSGRNVEALGDSFSGVPAQVGVIRRHFPKAWAWSPEQAKACTKEYILFGWSGIVPESCRKGTIMIPLNKQWAFWGWPNRLIQRMNSVGAKVIVIGPYGSETGTGLTLPEQLGSIPSSFKGYIWVDDIWTVGPALRPSRDYRNQAQIDAAEAGLKRRRERMN
jgi:glycerophosphoryl diester phosphodiesterase